MRTNGLMQAPLALNPSERPELSGPTSTSTSTAPDFGAEMASFIGEVDAQQRMAEQESVKLASGGGPVHETALALEKADIERRLLMKGRNKILEAYQEISRMPV